MGGGEGGMVEVSWEYMLEVIDSFLHPWDLKANTLQYSATAGKEAEFSKIILTPKVTIVRSLLM